MTKQEKRPNRQKSPLERVPTRKLAADLRKELLGKLDEKDPDWKAGNSKKK